MSNPSAVPSAISRLIRFLAERLNERHRLFELSELTVSQRLTDRKSRLVADPEAIERFCTADRADAKGGRERRSQLDELLRATAAELREFGIVKKGQIRKELNLVNAAINELDAVRVPPAYLHLVVGATEVDEQTRREQWYREQRTRFRDAEVRLSAVMAELGNLGRFAPDGKDQPSFVATCSVETLATPGEPMSGHVGVRFTKLLNDAATSGLKGNGAKILRMLCESDGERPLKDLAVVFNWPNLHDNWNSAKKRLAAKLRPLGFFLSTQSGKAVLSPISQ